MTSCHEGRGTPLANILIANVRVAHRCPHPPTRGVIRSCILSILSGRSRMASAQESFETCWIAFERGVVLFVHEVHKVVGKTAVRFEGAYRNGWMPTLAEGSDARLVWYLDLAHGSGLAYRVVTITAVRDGAAWARLATRMASGDLQSWARGPRRTPTRVRWPDHGATRVVALDRVIGGHTDRSDRARTHDLYGRHDVAVPRKNPGLHSGRRRRVPTDTQRRGVTGADAHRTCAAVHAGSGQVSRSHPYAEAVEPSPVGPAAHPRHPCSCRSTRIMDARSTELRDQWQSRLLRTAVWSPLQ